jgi:phosphatidylinositol 4-kinase
MKNFRERFVLERDERGAAEWMGGLVRSARASQSTAVYDRFQLITNGIPY